MSPRPRIKHCVSITYSQIDEPWQFASEGIFLVLLITSWKSLLRCAQQAHQLGSLRSQPNGRCAPPCSAYSTLYFWPRPLFSEAISSSTPLHSLQPSPHCPPSNHLPLTYHPSSSLTLLPITPRESLSHRCKSLSCCIWDLRWSKSLIRNHEFGLIWD